MPICIFRDGSKKEYERSELYIKKRQTSSDGSGYSASAPSSPHSKVSPRFSPRLSPRVGPTTSPSSSATSQPASVTTSQAQSKAPSLAFADEVASFSRQHSLQVVCTTSSQSLHLYGTALQEKIKDGAGRPTLLPPSTFPGGQRKILNTLYIPKVHVCI